MVFRKNTVSIISVVLIGLILNACSAYSAHRVPKETPPAYEGHLIRLIWGYQVSKALYMTDATVKDNNLMGNRQIPTSDKQNKKQLINIYLDEATARPDSLVSRFSFPVSSITKIEVYDYDPVLSVIKTVFCVAGISALALSVIFLVILLTKESCPFIYSYNGDSFEFTGEIYSGAIFPSLERHDYLPLPNLKPLDNQYQLTIANKVKEIQYTNLAELLIIDHPKDTDVLLDKAGNYLTIGKHLQSPKTAIATDKSDILSLVTSKDSLKYFGDAYAETSQSKDTIELSFDRPADTGNAKLVIRAKNSYWLDYTLGQFFNLFGDKYEAWYKKQIKSPDAEQHNWSLEQGLPLSVYIKKNGEWQFVDYFNVVGPMAERDLVMPIDLSSLDSNSIELKLEGGSLFWEIDYAAMDYTPQQKIYQSTAKLTSAVDEKGNNVTALMNKDDKDYYVMPVVGNQALMKFEASKVHDGCDRTVFLHSKGHYEVLRDAKGAPDVSYLKTFREPGKFGQFSRERFKEANKRVNE